LRRIRGLRGHQSHHYGSLGGRSHHHQYLALSFIFGFTGCFCGRGRRALAGGSRGCICDAVSHVICGILITAALRALHGGSRFSHDIQRQSAHACGRRARAYTRGPCGAAAVHVRPQTLILSSPNARSTHLTAVIRIPAAAWPSIALRRHHHRVALISRAGRARDVAGGTVRVRDVLPGWGIVTTPGT
jgi:hypothetical protein